MEGRRLDANRISLHDFADCSALIATMEAPARFEGQIGLQRNFSPGDGPALSREAPLSRRATTNAGITQVDRHPLPARAYIFRMPCTLSRSCSSAPSLRSHAFRKAFATLLHGGVQLQKAFFTDSPWFSTCR